MIPALSTNSTGESVGRRAATWFRMGRIVTTTCAVATRKKRQRALFRDGVFREHVDENKRNLSQQNLLLKRQQVTSLLYRTANTRLTASVKVAKKMHEVRDRVRARRQLLAIQRQQLDALLTTNADRQLSVEQVHQMVALRLAWTRKRWLAIAGAVSSAHAFATIFHARRQIHLARLVATRAAVTIQVGRVLRVRPGPPLLMRPSTGGLPEMGDQARPDPIGARALRL